MKIKRKIVDKLFCSVRKKFRRKSKMLRQKYKGTLNGHNLFKASTYANADMFMLETQLFIIDNYLNYRDCILVHNETAEKIVKVRDAIKWILDNREDLYMEDELKDKMKDSLNIIADFYKNGDVFGMWF